MIKAVFFDVDGTLVSFKDHKIPESTIESINTLRDKGIKVFVATGRPPMIIGNLSDLKFDGYISLNGAYCYRPNGEIISKSPIASSNVKTLVDHIQTFRAFSCIFVRERDSFANYLDDVAHKAFETINVPISTMGKILPIEAALENDVFQIISFINIEEEKALLPNLPDCISARWSPNFTDIVNSKVSKRLGIDQVLTEFGISPSEAMAFGDGGNDISMLKHVGTGIVMGGATDEVKMHGDYIAEELENDGIYKALRHFNLI